MALTTRTAAQIREAWLATLRADYLARGEDLDIQEGSDAWMRVGAIALFCEGVQQQAAINATQIFVDTASAANLDHWARVYSQPRQPATFARLTINATTTGASSWTTANTLAASDGTVFAPVASGSTPSAGTVSIAVEARTAGTAGNKSAGSIITWQSAPSGMNSTATVTASVITAVDEETDAQLAARILGYIRERPASFNRADVRAFSEAVPGVQDAFVYPLLHPTLDVNTPGCVTVIPMGPAGARVLGAGDLAAVASALQGECPVGIPTSEIYVEAPSTVAQNVTAQVTLGTGYAWPFSGTFTLASGSTTTVVNTTTDPSATVANDDYVAVPSAPARGGYEIRKVTARSSSSVTVTPALSAAPSAGGTLRPAPQNWDAMLSAVLAVFDRLGPGDASPPCRWPGPIELGHYTLFRSSVIAALVGLPGLPGAPAGVPGVVAVSLTTPVSDVTPAAKQIVVPGTIIFTE